MEDKGLSKMLAWLVFISCMATAFSLGVLGYVFVMGELPFGIQSMSNDIQRKNSALLQELANAKAKAPEAASDNPLRGNEEFIATLAADLKREREKIAADRAAVEEQRKNAEQIMKQAGELQTAVEAKEKAVDELIKKVDSKEKANVADLQKLIGGMVSTNPATAKALLLSLDETLAARVLYSMNKKAATALIADGMSGGSKEKIILITKKMQTLSDELKVETPK